MNLFASTNYCGLCGATPRYFIVTYIEVPCQRSRITLCQPCLNRVYAGRYHHILASSYWVIVGPYRREVHPPHSEAA
jgi:hypothetical protein